MDPNTAQPPLQQTSEQPEVTTSNTNLSSYFIKNKMAIVFLVIVLIIVLVIVAFNVKRPAENTNTIALETPIPTTNQIPSNSAASHSEISTSPATTQIDPVMQQQIKPQIDQRVSVPYAIAAEKTYTDTWAMVQISNPTTDPANIILKKINGQWTVVLGPGTHFSQDELTGIGAPQSLINEANSNLIPPSSQ